MTSPGPEFPTFFDSGIRFECTKCGACCTGAPGTVAVSDEEADALAAFLGLTRTEFEARYLRPAGGGLSIRERANGDCVFLRSGHCVVHDARPLQCRTYPFWFKNLRSPERWARACAECPGIGQGRLFSCDEVLALVHQDLESSARPEGPA